MVRITRVYGPPSPEDGRRILVGRLWPRGLSRKEAAIGERAKDLAPSDQLRGWFGHDPKKWAEFRKRYRAELLQHEGVLRGLARRTTCERVTLVYGAKDTKHNNAVVLMELLGELRKGEGSK